MPSHIDAERVDKMLKAFFIIIISDHRAIWLTTSMRLGAHETTGRVET